mgnify:CR=1 FL=1
MKLNTQGLNELRKKVEEQLVNVPEGQRVHIDKELLDDLIFFKGKNKDGKVIKVPVWTGEFLRKIDLSEISFENVLFQISFDEFEDSMEEVMDAEDVSRFIKTGDDRFPRYHVPFANNNGTIDFSYTNAPISTIFKRKDNHVLRISNCNFEGVDLSNVTLYLTDFGLNTNGFSISLNNNFKNTGIRLITTNKIVNKALNSHDESIKAEKEQEARDIISKMIALGYLDGCYIDGYLIENTMITDKQEPNRKEELLKQYEELLIQKKNIWDESIGKVRK